jgi:hypothetical protein
MFGEKANDEQQDHHQKQLGQGFPRFHLFLQLLLVALRRRRQQIGRENQLASHHAVHQHDENHRDHEVHHELFQNQTNVVVVAQEVWVGRTGVVSGVVDRMILFQRGVDGVRNGKQNGNDPDD